jgi:hypothetical protein
MATALDQSANGGDDTFSYVLEFAAANCPGCGRPGEPGACSECGEMIGTTDELSPATRARIAALGPLSSRINELVVGFGQIPQGHIPLTADQMLTAVTDAELFEQIEAMTRLGYELGAHDLNDPVVIGRDLRRLVQGHVGRVERLLETCQLLGRFDASGPAADLKLIAIEAGRYGASLALSTVETLVAPDLSTAREAQAQLQELLDEVPFAGGYSELLERIRAESRSDPDARVALVLGQTGRFTDELGLPDLPRVFAAFADQEMPFEAIAARARSYFSHLIDPNAPRDIGLESMLILPAVGLASLDRPLLGHRIAEQGHDLLAKAWQQDSGAVQELMERTSNQGQIVFAAAGRIEVGFRMLGLAEAQGMADDQAILKTVMEAYLDLAEGAYRTYGWLIRDLVTITSGSAVASEPEPPMLTSLAQQLEASGEELGQLFAATSDSRLRNARGHGQYHWDAEGERIQDLRTGQEWTVEELETTLLAMVGAILGVDAAYSAFLAGGEASASLPDWLIRGKSAGANRLMAQISFGGFGFEVLGTSDDGSTIVIERPDKLDKLRLMSAAAGVAGVIRDLDNLAVTDAEDAVLLELDPSSIREALSVPEAVRDLACLGPLLSDAERAGTEPAEALKGVLWIQVAATVIGGVRDLVDAGGWDADVIHRIDQRFSFVLDFARGRSGAKSKGNRKLLERVGKARSAAFAASNDPARLDHLVDQLTRLLQSVQDRGISWPWS